MAVLNKIIIRDYRNIEMAELDFSPKINCITGNNGEGKTNLLDAVYYLSMTKSVFSVSDRFNCRYGQDGFSVAGSYRLHNGLASKVSVSFLPGGEKKLKRDEKTYARISEHIGGFPVVMVTPSDISLVSDSGEERRKFMNAVLSQMDKTYLYDMQQYNRLLAQRNRALKGAGTEEELLAVFDAEMSAPAGRIHRRRKEFAEKLAPVISEYYALLSGGRETVSVRYASDLDKCPLGDLLSARREKDRFFGYTSAGVHRDDLVFEMDGCPIRRCGSQGQQKSFLVSLKFAQYEIMKAAYGFEPILLLDDIFDKLDFLRISNLLGLVTGRGFGQIFLTDTDLDRIAAIVDGFAEDKAYFQAAGGHFRKMELERARGAGG